VHRLMRDENVSYATALARAAEIAAGKHLDSEDPLDHDDDGAERVGALLGFHGMFAREVAFLNDDDFGYHGYPRARETPERRYRRMLQWVEDEIVEEPPE